MLSLRYVLYWSRVELLKVRGSQPCGGSHDIFSIRFPKTSAFSCCGGGIPVTSTLRKRMAPKTIKQFRLIGIIPVMSKLYS